MAEFKTAAVVPRNPNPTPEILQFGSGYQLDVEGRQLSRAGRSLKLERIPMEILILLLEYRGQLVSRAQIVDQIWGQSVLLDTDNNINAAIRKIRYVLKDQAEQPRFVQTVIGRGYRFISPVECCSTDAPAVSPLSETLTPPPEQDWRKILWRTGAGSRGLTAGVLLLLLASLVAFISVRRTAGPSLQPLSQRRLTANPPDQPVTHASLSPDGKYLGFSDRTGVYLQQIDGNQIRSLAPPAVSQSKQSVWEFESWYPSSNSLTARLATPGKPASLWRVPLNGSPVELIRDVYGRSRVAFDGTQIAFLREPVFLESDIGDPYTLGAKEIWVMGTGGETPRRILTAEEHSGFESIAWLPGTHRLAYKYWRWQGNALQVTVESSELDGSQGRTLLADSNLQDFAFTSRSMLYSRKKASDSTDYSADNLWVLRWDAKSGAPQGAPQRLTDWSGFSITGLSIGSGGRQLCFLRSTHRQSAFAGELEDNGARLVGLRRLTADDHSNVPFAWTPDSKRVIFLSRRAQSPQIYQQDFTGAAVPQLISPAPTIHFSNVRVSPDHRWLIAKDEPPPPAREKFYRIPIGGGAPEVIFEAEPGLDGDLRCTAQSPAFCVYAVHSSDQKELVLKRFDAFGKGEQLLRIPVDIGGDYHWGLSPNGRQVAILKTEWNCNRIRLFSLLGDRLSRSISVEGEGQLRSIDWFADSQSLLAGNSGPSGSALLHINLDGRTQILWSQPQPLNTWGVPSPDGKHLAIFGTEMDANAWSVEYPPGF